MKKIALVAAFLLAACSSSGSGSVGSSPPATPTTTKGTSGAATTSSSTPVQPPTPGTGHSTPTLTGFRVVDLTWVGSHGWALGTADCLSGSGRCDAIEQTLDGKTWTSLPAPLNAKAQVSNPINTCTGNCVTGLRFATDFIGYAYGPEAFYTTKDGGHTWTKRNGGALFLEAANGNAIRVISSGGGCPGPCGVGIQTAPIGTDTWTTRFAPRNLADFGLLFGRTGQRAFLLVEGHVAGGGESAKSTLYASGNDGRTWTQRGEPCPQLDREDDSVALSIGPDGAAAVVCRARAATNATYVAVSTDGGATFEAGSHTALGADGVTGFGAASGDTILVVRGDDTVRSTDAGHTFTRLAAGSGRSPGNPRYIGFASKTTGHAVSADSRTIFTTTDAGRTWRAHTFG